MYQTEADLREERTRRLMYLLFGISMFISVAICGVLLFLVLTPAQQQRLLGREGRFAVGQVVEVPVKRLELSKLLPNSPQWSEDIIFVIKQPDQSYQAFLALDPQTGCKLNWKERQFVDSCSQTSYSISGRNQTDVTSLTSRPRQMLELRVETREGNVYVLDEMLRRDRR